jgi:glycine reductase complex component B subunit gamma
MKEVVTLGIKIVHYINQFYGGIGGEDKADYAPEKISGVKGPGMGLQAAFGDKATISSTIICGDSYFNENIEAATEVILEMIKEENPDVFIAGPAFNAGRYGVACGAVCKAVSENLNIPVVTGMYIENPGADMYKKNAYMVETTNSAAGMKDAIAKVAALALKLGTGAAIGTPEEEGYMARGVRRNIFCEDRGAKRAVDMLVQKLKGEVITTEYPMPTFDRVDPAEPVKDVRKAKIAIVSSGGPVPKGNPDHIESSSASKYGKYSIKGIDDLTPENGETAHGGYDPVYANLDLDRVIPVDILREMEKSGEIGSLHDFYYSTVGNGTSVNNSKKFAAEIAKDLKDSNVDAVILTST